MSPRSVLLNSLIVLFATTPLLAHDPFESTMTAKVQENRLEIAVTMSREMALVYSGNAQRELPNPGDISAVLPDLASRAGALIEVREGETVIKPKETDVALNESGEPRFVLVFPKPGSAPLRISAVFLERLPVKNHCAFSFSDESQSRRSSAILTREKREAVVPPAGI